MAMLADFKFFDSNSTVTESNVLYLPPNAEELVVQATGNSVDVDIEGKTDTENGDWASLALVKHEDYSLCSKIDAEAIYSAAVGGIRQIRAVNNGSAGDVTLYGTVISGG